MDRIRIVGVPEHFNFPWVKIVEEQPLKAKGILLEWRNEPKGSGAMNKAIRAGEADLAVILTESFIKDRIEGNPGKIIGYHVRTPLIWGVHVSSQFKDKSLEELQRVPFVISRYGSGSHLMAFLLARKMGWDIDNLQFEVSGDIEGAERALKSPEPKMFLWEKYMTKPLVDQGVFSRVGEIPTPWPCFVIVASPDALERHPEKLEAVRDFVYQKSSALLQTDTLAGLLSEKYGILEKDIQAWLSQTQWATDDEVSSGSLEATMEILASLDLIKAAIPVEELVDQKLVRLT